MSPKYFRRAPQGIGFNFIDGEPNLKYLPQRPVQLHEAPPLPPPALAPPDSRAASLTRASAGTSPMSKGLKRVAAPGTSSASTAEGKILPVPDRNVAKHGVRLATHQTSDAGTSRQQPPGSTAGFPSNRDRPHSSPAVRGGTPRGGREEGMASPRRHSPTRGTVVRNDATSGSQDKGGKKVELPRPRPKTADGRDIDITKLGIPTLEDPTDPAMVAFRYIVAPTIQRRSLC